MNFYVESIVYFHIIEIRNKVKTILENSKQVLRINQQNKRP